MTRLARSDSFVGKIQRGLGSGYLEALDKPLEVVESAVLHCLANDPRLNAQDEDRDLFYARLVLVRGIDDGPIRTLLAADPDHDQSDSNRDWLPLGVLCLLARSGRPGAIAAVRDYVGWGAWWAEAVDELGLSEDPATWEGLDRVLLARFGSDARERIRSERGHSTDEPWPAWRAAGPLAQIFAIHPIPESPAIDLGSLPAAALLRMVRGSGPSRPSPAAALLARRIRSGSTADRAIVEEALRGDDVELAARAIHVLGLLGDPSIVAVGERVLRGLGGFGSGHGQLRISVLLGYQGLEGPLALEVARRWRDATDYRNVIATQLLQLHATDADLDWLVERIRWAARGHRDLFSYARILRRYPGRGPFEGFVDIYCQYVPTCCRADLLDAMSITDPDFGSSLAFESLFDCEPLARRAAVRSLDLSIPNARRRLADLQSDRLEEGGVRTAAAERIG